MRLTENACSSAAPLPAQTAEARKIPRQITMQRKILVTLTGVCLLVAALPVFAHHAFTAEFDAKKPLKLRGTVAKVELINPHSWIHIDVKNPDGTTHPLDDRGWHPEHTA